jgi:tRNA 2-selenouridine synthase
VAKKVLAKNLRNTRGVIIDVRSESEFLDGHVPGAINIPLLNDAERAEIGTLYAQKGPDLARRRGLEIVRPKISTLHLQISQAAGIAEGEITQPTEEQWTQVFNLVSNAILAPSFAETDEAVKADAPLTKKVPGTLIFYCWRGGARSRSMAQFAELLGFDVAVVEGGHKAFRQEVLSYLEGENYGFKLCVLYGLTGSGKTKILRQWLNEKKPVIDLEALAHHRGSAFGQVGIEILGRQKEFENNLFWEMQKLLGRGEKLVVVEGESQRIGRCKLPSAFMTAMEKGVHVKAEISLRERVQNILSEYVGGIDETQMLVGARGALNVIKKRLGGEKFGEISKLLDEKNYAAFTEQLLLHYYDKAYARSRAPGEHYALEIATAGEWEKLIAVIK